MVGLSCLGKNNLVAPHRIRLAAYDPNFRAKMAYIKLIIDERRIGGSNKGRILDTSCNDLA